MRWSFILTIRNGYNFFNYFETSFLMFNLKLQYQKKIISPHLKVQSICIISMTSLVNIILHYRFLSRFLPNFRKFFPNRLKSQKITTLRILSLGVIWHLVWEIWAKLKDFLRSITCSWHQKTNSPILEFKVLHKIQRAF